MKWYNVELKRVDADGLKRVLKDNGVKYETSQADAMIHFEILLNESSKEYETINDFLSAN